MYTYLRLKSYLVRLPGIRREGGEEALAQIFCQCVCVSLQVTCDVDTKEFKACYTFHISLTNIKLIWVGLRGCRVRCMDKKKKTKESSWVKLKAFPSNVGQPNNRRHADHSRT